MQNFSSLAGLEEAEKFVVGWVKEGSIGLYFKGGERVGVLMQSL